VSATDAGFWIHFDVDVLDPEVFSAPGDPAPGGISFEEPVELLEPLVQNPKARACS
jgi:arginase